MACLKQNTFLEDIPDVDAVAALVTKGIERYVAEAEVRNIHSF